MTGVTVGHVKPGRPAEVIADGGLVGFVRRPSGSPFWRARLPMSLGERLCVTKTEAVEWLLHEAGYLP